MNQKKMVKRFFCFSGFLFLGLSYCQTYAAEEKTTAKGISAGMNLPQITLNAPKSEKDREYLALKDSKPFSLQQVSAKLIVLEIFSVYCPHCRMQAPKLNKIYKLIQQDKGLSQGIKIMGIAAAGDQTKTDKWKATLRVSFPLFADSEAAIWERLGKPGVPLTLLITNSGKIVSMHPGVTEDVEEFFRDIQKMYMQQ